MDLANTGDMNHQLTRKVASLFALVLCSAFVASAQTTAATQPSPPSEIKSGQGDGADLIESIKRGELPAVAKILFAGTSADAVDGEGGRALCWAVRVNRRDIVELLLTKGTDVNKEEDDGGTALDVAAAAGHADLVRLLLSRGAVVNHKDHGGHTALILSVVGAVFSEIPPFVLKAIVGEEPTEKGEQLRSNMGTEHKKVMELLLQAGADANIQPEDCGITALMIAGLGGNVALVQTLLSHGANVNLKSGEWDALRFTEAFESPEAIAGLEAEDAETKEGLLIWSQATAARRQQVAKMLRAAGARD